MSEARAIAPRVTVLPATRNRFTTAPIASVQKRRVAAYARVSTDSDEQLTSYEAQVDYYTHYIKERPDWSFAGMYADEGISGTNTKRREGFNQMITDALAHYGVVAGQGNIRGTEGPRNAVATGLLLAGQAN